MNAGKFKRYILRRLPYQVVAAVSAALAITFAAAAASVAAYPSLGEEAAYADTAGAIKLTPFEYFPGKYKNQATDIEPLPPQF